MASGFASAFFASAVLPFFPVVATGGFQPFADFGSIADVFAAFFGEDLVGGGAQRRRPSRGGDVQAVVEVDLEEAFTGLAVTVPAEVAAQLAEVVAPAVRV